MRKLIIAFIGLLTYGTIMAQEFETGYFIDNDNNRIECLIQNMKWRESPLTVFYRLKEDSQVLELNYDNCMEFGIGEEFKFRSIDAKIPLTKSKTSDKNTSAEPTLVQRKQFALVLIQGKVSLYRVINAAEEVFLIEKLNGQIETLLYKEYLDNNFKIKRNSLFKRQLLKDYNCQNGTDIQSLQYDTKSMLLYFGDLNRCLGDSDYKVYKNELKQGLFSSASLKVWGGAQQNGYETRNLNTGQVFSFDDEIAAKGGLELEAFIGSITKRNASIFLGLQYSKVSNELSLPIGELSGSTLNLDVNVIELALGFRYYIGLSEKSDIFLDAAVAVNFYSNPSFTQTRIFNGIISRPPETSEFATISRSNDIVPSFGIGYSFNKKFYARFNYLIDQNLIDRNRDNLSQISLSVGYSI
ncbi:MAG: hypothetical protein AAFO99_13280 [Bacteroidota bacterium]